MLVWSFLVYAIAAVPISLLIWWISRLKKMSVSVEFLFVPIPFIVWYSLMLFFSLGKKSLSNVVIEAFACGALGGLILLPSVMIFPQSSATKLRSIILSTLTAVGATVLIFCLTPFLKE